MQIRANVAPEHERLRGEAVKDAVANYFPDIDTQKLRYRQYARLVDAITKSELEYMMNEEYNYFDKYESKLFDRSIKLINSIHFALYDVNK
jgi:hypothetical protein